MGRSKKIAEHFVKDGLKDTWEGITGFDRSGADRISKGVLGVASIGIGAAVGLIGLGMSIGKKASEKSKDSFCTQCGNSLLENTRFCVKCGCKI